MGTFRKGILGGFSGTVGTVVGATWRGMDVMRSRPKKSGSAPTAQQLLQREKFSLAIQFQNSLRTMQKRLYGNNAGVKSRVNLAASQLLREVVAEQNGQVVLLMNKVQITKGDRTGFQNLAVTAAVGETLGFTWVDNSEQVMAEETDIFSCAIYEPETGVFHIQEGPEVRTSELAAVVLPEEWNGALVHVFAFFQSAEQNTACNSLYLGPVTVI